MVSLSTAYSLCTLIDQGGFLHVSEDENDCYIVTLGRNIVIRYKLTDQKQLNSWSTIPQLTSKVVYNSETQQYIGIFNDNVIKHWSQEDNSLDKASKIKIKHSAYEIILDNVPIVLFKNGACCKLSYLEDKKYSPIKGFLSEDTKISSAKVFDFKDKKCMCLIASNTEKYATLYSFPLHPALVTPVTSSMKTLKLRRRSHTLLGSCFAPRDDGCSLVTLWSDGFLYSLPLPLGQDNSEPHLGQFMGVLRNVSLSSPVALTSLSPHHLAVYGGDPSEEGAILAVYNLVFGMIQTSTSFKMLQKPPRVWAIHGRLLVGLGQRLVCVPYSLQTDCVAALVGTRPPGTEAQSSEITAVVPIVPWGEAAPKKNGHTSAPSDLHSAIDELAAQGSSETRTCEVLISQSIENEDIKKLTWCLDHFLYIPENLTVRLLKFALTASDGLFKPNEPPLIISQPPTEEMPLVNGKSLKSKKEKSIEKMKLLVDQITNELKKVELEPNPLSSEGRSELLDRILAIPSNSRILVPVLRSGLTITNCILLLRYLSYLVSSGKINLEITINWATIVIDAFYQQLVLGRHSECIESVKHLQKQVSETVLMLNELKEVLPVVHRLKTKKGVKSNPIQSKNYSIQKIQIFK